MESGLNENKFYFCDSQQYCNYPEISKPFRCLLSDEDETSSDTCSSGLPSCTLDVSDTQSQLRLFRSGDASPSLGNFLRLSPSSEDDEDITDSIDVSHASSNEGQFDEEDQHKHLSRSNDDVYLDPEGWMKYASDPDPWNTKNYKQTAFEKSVFRNGVLTHEDVSEQTSNLIQLPDNKAFVFSRLHINKMDLENVSVLSKYRYFLYIDMSHNSITELEGLNHCNYLMYLNASHNKIKKVLDFQPPWFLTHVNLRCNEIKEIGTGNISACWSLSYLDLSYNLIEKIDGLRDLKYLKYLNLSHNYIQRVENLHCSSLQELNLSSNRILGFNAEDESLQNLEDLIKLNLANNQLTSLHNLENFKSLKKLDVSENKITDFHEMYKIEGLNKLREMKMTGNGICASRGYREFLIFKISSLDILDTVPVGFQERVAARMLWEPDIFTRKTHLRTKIELWNQLAKQTIDVTTTPYGQPSVPLVVLVGTFGTNKKEIAKRLALRFPDQLYRCRQVTTIPLQGNYDEGDFSPLSVDSFNNLIKDGKLLFYYKEIGGLFGMGMDQLCKCVMENKVGIIESTLEGALVLRSTACCPYLILCVKEDASSYEEKLNTFFTESNLWKRFHPSNLKKETIDSREDPEENEVVTTNEFESASSLPECNKNHSVTSNLSHQSTLFSERNFVNEQLYTIDESLISEENPTTIQQDVISRDEEFVWEWTYEPSVIYDVEPSESQENLVRGREAFVQNTLQEQNMYLEMNHSHPSLFTAAVYSDDIDTAVKHVGKTCCEIYNKRERLIKTETLLEQPVCKAFVEARVQSLLRDLVNVPSGI